MHLLKIILLLVATLSGMRLFSWALLWGLLRLLPEKTATSVVAANTAALLVFGFLLYLNRVPGEVVDTQGAVFGVCVYAVFACIDLRWRPACLRSTVGPRGPRGPM